MHEVQVNLAIMQNVVQNPMVAIDSFSKKVAALPLKDRLATTKATAMRTVIDSLGVPSQVYSEDGTEFNKEFKQPEPVVRRDIRKGAWAQSTALLPRNPQPRSLSQPSKPNRP